VVFQKLDNPCLLRRGFGEVLFVKERRLYEPGAGEFGFAESAQSLDDMGRPFGKVGDGAVLDLALPVERFAQQDTGWRVAVGDALNKHGYLLERKYRNEVFTGQGYFEFREKFKWLHSEDKKGSQSPA